jgi:hypothetical protein
MRALLLSCIALTACTDDLTLGETTYAINSPGFDTEGTCPVWGCGSNSPIIEAAWFHDLHERGLPNAQGFSVTSFQKETSPGIWRSYWPDVRNGVLRAVSRANPSVVVWENTADIIGMRLVVEHPSGSTIHIYVHSVNSAPFWARPPGMPATLARVRARTYELRWKFPDAAMHRIAVCGQYTPYNGMYPFHAVLFEDDRINADALEVTGEEANWFNIGCKDHALAKLHLMGHTRAAANVINTQTTLNERTALLKMFTADYCGNGNPFTVAGTSIKFRDNHNWFNDIPLSSSQYDIEARWTHNGAICLNEPRVDFQGGAVNFPGGVEPLLATGGGWCTEDNPRPPPCLGDDVSNFWGAHIISANPYD